MIRPLGDRILVKVLPRYGGLEEKLNLVLVDRKRHFEGVRRGVVEYVGSGVQSVRTGEIILFAGDLGESFGMGEFGINDGTEFRRLKVRDCLAVEEVLA